MHQYKDKMNVAQLGVASGLNVRERKEGEVTRTLNQMFIHQERLANIKDRLDSVLERLRGSLPEINEGRPMRCYNDGILGSIERHSDTVENLLCDIDGLLEAIDTTL